ncbi:hypothetical protein HanIR_Chr02g0080041 [Helianthus annuus]|nr:hypothetical protein HanIR_Chr02g0080041 [Helianthus annuus]
MNNNGFDIDILGVSYGLYAHTNPMLSVLNYSNGQTVVIIHLLVWRRFFIAKGTNR